MKKAIIILGVLISALGVRAQVVTVTGSVQDVNGNIYANGSVHVNLEDANGNDLSNTPVNVGGVQITLPAITNGLSSTGAFSVQLWPNTQIGYSTSTQWEFDICSQVPIMSPSVLTPPQTCFHNSLTISAGGSITGSLTPTALAVTVPNGISGTNAVSINGGSVPVGQACLGSNGSGQPTTGCVLTPTGTIYQTPSPITGLLSGWSTNGATPTYSSNALVFSGLGGNPSTQTYDYQYNTTLPVWGFNCTITLGVIATSDQGIGCGIRSIEASSVFNGLSVWIDDSTTQANSGHLVVFNPATSSTSVSLTTATMTAADVWLLSVNRNQDTITVVATDTTTQGAPLTVTIVAPMTFGVTGAWVLPNIGHFAMMAFGTTPGSITAATISTQQPPHVPNHCVGDSKAVGYYQGTFQQSWCQLLANTYGYNIDTFAGGSDTSADLVANLPEFEIYFKAGDNVFFECCSNDIRNGVSLATIEANVANVVSTLTAAGVHVWVLQSFYETGISQSALDTYFNAQYGPSGATTPNTYITNPGTNYVNSASTILAGDNIHPNSFYASLIAASINSFLYGTGKVTYTPYRPAATAGGPASSLVLTAVTVSSGSHTLAATEGSILLNGSSATLVMTATGFPSSYTVLLMNYGSGIPTLTGGPAAPNPGCGQVDFWNGASWRIVASSCPLAPQARVASYTVATTDNNTCTTYFGSGITITLPAFGAALGPFCFSNVGGASDTIAFSGSSNLGVPTTLAIGQSIMVGVNASNQWYPWGATPPWIASGTSALGTGAISATTCASAVTTTATGAAATDSINWAFNAAPSTGYTSGLVVLPYVTTGNVNFLVCNPTAGSLTPAAATLNWRVAR